MEPLDELRAKIADFPGYGDELERRRSDEYVRAYLGEALAAFAARTELDPGVRQRLDELTLRLAFADQRAFSEHLRSGEEETGDGAVMRADAAAVELAGRAATLDAGSAPRFLDEVATMLDGREAALRAAALKMA
ncbi:MAG TPA: hypothetical protein VFE16_04330 [Candidatus Cybelea sp.]|jgi:hypothetical protein|nr:hypothetical protein [Candidatus Cybelea sp.]